MGPFEQVGPECPPLSILPKVSGGNGREWEEGGRGAKQRKPKSDGGGFRLLGLGGLGCGGFQPHHITVNDHCV